MIQRGQELPSCQVAGRTEDDKHVRLNLMFRHPQDLSVNGPPPLVVMLKHPPAPLSGQGAKRCERADIEVWDSTVKT
jgi:hypothetical protein